MRRVAPNVQNCGNLRNRHGKRKIIEIRVALIFYFRRPLSESMQGKFGSRPGAHARAAWTRSDKRRFRPVPV